MGSLLVKDVGQYQPGSEAATLSMHAQVAAQSNMPRLVHEFGESMRKRYATPKTIEKAWASSFGKPYDPNDELRRLVPVFANIAFGAISLMRIVLEHEGKPVIEGTNLAYWFAAPFARPRGMTRPILPQVLELIEPYVDPAETLWTIVRPDHWASRRPLEEVLGFTVFDNTPRIFAEWHSKPVIILHRPPIN